MALTRVELTPLSTLSARFCRDVRLGRIRNGVPNPNTSAGSEIAIRADAYAAPVLEIKASEMALQDATMADRSTGDDLRRLCEMYGVPISGGAGAQGSLVAECTGSVTYVKDLEGKTDDGLRYLVTTSVTVTNGGSIPVACADAGKRTDKPSGTKITWTSPPAGSSATALVDGSGLTNGVDADNDASLRRKLQDRLRHPAGSGAWAHYAAWAEADAAVEKAFVYPAKRGPATVDVVITIKADKDNLTGAYTRQASATLVNRVACNVVKEDPEHADVLVTTVANQGVDVVLRVALPAAVADGGTGGGWFDQTTVRWPIWVGTTGTHLEAAPATMTQIRVDTIAGGNAPVAEAHIAIWSTSKKKFVHSRVKSFVLVAGFVYDVELYDAIDTSIVAPGDFISPDAEKLDDYGTTIAEQFADLGPGEKAGVVSIALPRSYRRPLHADSWPGPFTSKHVGELSNLHPEVGHVATVLPSTMPIVPTVATPIPNILVLGNFALYAD